MFIRVSISLACLALLVLGAVLVMNGGSDQVSVNGLETQQASRDEGAVASADGRAGDREEARSKSEAAKIDSGHSAMTDEMFNALPDEKKVAVSMGVDISKHDSIRDYFDYLDSRVKAGDLSFSLEAAALCNRCLVYMREPLKTGQFLGFQPQHFTI